MLSKLQKEHAIWQRRNFPHAEKWECLVGLHEEIGELAHSFLKKHQGIRNDENHDANIEDAVGDIVIYLMGFCTLNDIDIDQCIEGAWGIVKDRDWRNDGNTLTGYREQFTKG